MIARINWVGWAGGQGSPPEVGVPESVASSRIGGLSPPRGRIWGNPDWLAQEALDGGPSPALVSGLQAAYGTDEFPGRSPGGEHWGNSVDQGSPLQDFTRQGPSLASNKQAMLEALDAAGASDSTKMLVLAIGNQETQQASVNQRDTSKDGDPKRKNYSALNLNGDMLDQLYANRDPAWIDGLKGVLNGSDDRESIKAAALVMNDAVQRWGADKAITFLRSGGGAFSGGRADNSVLPDLPPRNEEYFRNVGRIAKTLQVDPNLMTDDRRINIGTGHI